jgi:hypothetical protein
MTAAESGLARRYVCKCPVDGMIAAYMAVCSTVVTPRSTDMSDDMSGAPDYAPQIRDWWQKGGQRDVDQTAVAAPGTSDNSSGDP